MNPDDKRLKANEEFTKAFNLIAMAAPAGGQAALRLVLTALPENFPAVVAVQHLDPHHPSQMADILGKRSHLRVKQAQEGDRLAPGAVFIAPPGRHLPANLNETLCSPNRNRSILCAIPPTCCSNRRQQSCCMWHRNGWRGSLWLSM